MMEIEQELDLFDASGRVVYVRCVGSKKSFTIHKDLLHSKAPLLSFDQGQDGNFVLNLDMKFDAFRHFARWLYKGSVVTMDYEKGSLLWITAYPINELLEAYSFAKQQRCVDFMDTVIDEIVRMVFGNESFRVLNLVKNLVRYFPDGSAGRQIAVDFLVYGKAVSESDRDYFGYNFGYKELKELADPDFCEAIAREFLIAKGHKVTDRLESEPFSLVLAAGFLEAKAHEDIIITQSLERPATEQEDEPSKLSNPDTARRDETCVNNDLTLVHCGNGHREVKAILEPTGRHRELKTSLEAQVGFETWKQVQRHWPAGRKISS